MPELLPAGLALYLDILTAMLGLVMGSALNCLAFRMARKEPWAGQEQSRCPRCGHPLRASDLVPLLSWLVLRGRCRYCGERISPRYPLTEGLLALVYLTLLHRFGLSLHTLSAAVLCSCLLCLSLVDLDTQIIPNRFLVIPAVVRGIELLYQDGFPGLLTGLLPGLVTGGGVLLLSLLMDALLKKDTMGGGDIKLIALLGMFFSLPECLLLLMLACVTGILMAVLLRKASAAFPFGPALSLAAWLTLLFGEGLVSAYLRLF